MCSLFEHGKKTRNSTSSIGSCGPTLDMHLHWHVKATRLQGRRYGVYPEVTFINTQSTLSTIQLELCPLVPDSQQTPSHQLWISERISNSKSERKLTPASSDGVNSSESNPKVQLSSPDSESEEVERSVTSSTTTSTLPHVSGKGKRAETTVTTVITTTMVTRVLPTVVSL